jgi:hypothetical protein
MKSMALGLILIATAATAYAQVARPILPPAPYGVTMTDAFTLSGCVTSGGVDAASITMVNPTIARSSSARETLAGASNPITIPPIAITPMHLPPDLSYTEPAPVGTTGVGEDASVGTAGVSPNGLVGYRLIGADMSAWVGRRVRVSGTPVPLDPEAIEAISGSSAPYFQDFNVNSAVPLTGVCPP